MYVRIPIGRRYTTGASATVERRFRCPRCGFEAQAIAHGLGSGMGVSPFFIDDEGAKVDASVKAVFQARQQALFMLDIVPCPRCHLRDERAERFFNKRTRLVRLAACALGLSGLGLVGVMMKQPLTALLSGIAVAGVVILIDIKTRQANWHSATKRVTFEESRTEAESDSRSWALHVEEPGDDVHVGVALSPADASAGGKLDIVVTGEVPCHGCRGTGVWIGKSCADCRAGKLARQRRVRVTFPAGTQSGDRLRVAGMGMPGLVDAMPGDLYVNIEITSETTS